MNTTNPTVVLVHGAFAESSSWNEVIEHLRQKSIPTIAAANPLRSLGGDAAYVRDVIASVEGPVILVAHSYGGLVATEAAAQNSSVVALVYVAAFAGDTGENAFELSAKFPGSTLGEALKVYPVSSGGNEFAIREDVFHQQFSADVSAAQAALMFATQRPVTQAALTDGIAADSPAWKDTPSWFVFGDQDRNIPAELHRFMAERAGSRGTVEITGAAHALSVSQPGAVVASILAAIEGISQ